MSRRQPQDRRGAGEPLRVAVPVAELRDRDGNRQREILLGGVFHVLERETGRIWGFAAADGYLGWIDAAALGDLPAPSHRVAAIRTYAKPTPALKATEPILYLSLGSLVHVSDVSEGWARITLAPGALYVPAQHLASIDAPETDPAAVAERFLGTPYLWGGNSAFGIDCSGLVQAACAACGIDCPGDSDMQAAELGDALPPDAPLKRGDLVFWRGHVGIMADGATMVHANAHHMAVAREPLDGAMARIAAQGGGPVTARRRP